MKKTILLITMLAGFTFVNAQTVVFDNFNVGSAATRADYWNYYNSNYITAPVTNPSTVGDTSTGVGKYTRFVPVATNDQYQGLGSKLAPSYTSYAFFTSYNAVKIDVYAAQAFSLSIVLQDNHGTGAADLDVLTITQNYAAGDINTWKTLTFDFSSVNIVGNANYHSLSPGNGYALLIKFDDGLMNSTALDYYVDNLRGVTITPTTAVINGTSTSNSRLDQNSPNPFNAATSINYSLKQGGNVSLSVYDVLGKPVANLLNNQSQGAGDYNFDFNAESLKEGIYYYTLTVGDISETKRMVLQK